MFSISKNTLCIILTIIIILILISILLFNNYNSHKNKNITNKHKSDFTILNTPDEQHFINQSKTLPHWNIPDYLHKIIKPILNKLLPQINKATNSSYFLLSIENVFSYPINNTINLTIDFWVHETNLKITKRFITELNIDHKNKKITILKINTSNATNNDGITVEYNNNGIYTTTNDNTKIPLIKPTIDPQLILTDNNLLKNETTYILGVENNVLDYGEFIPITPNPINPLLGEVQKWILPSNILASVGNPLLNFPCRRQSFCWDTNGVNTTQPENITCQGINNSPYKKYPIIYDNPSYLKQLTNTNTNYLGLMGAVNTSGGTRSLTF